MLDPFLILEKTHEKDFKLIFNVLLKYNVKNNEDFFNNSEAQNEVYNCGAFSYAISGTTYQDGNYYHFLNENGINLIVVSINPINQKPFISTITTTAKEFIDNECMHSGGIRVKITFSKNEFSKISIFHFFDEQSLFFKDGYPENHNYYINNPSSYSKVYLDCITLINIYHYDNDFLLNYILLKQKLSNDFIDTYKLTYDIELNPLELDKYVSSINL